MTIIDFGQHSPRVHPDAFIAPSASVIGQGRRFDDRNNTVELPAYATLDLRAGYRLNPEWTASATWTNVLDRDYETIAGYPQPGQAFNLELRGAF